jgi:hypothetical protein
VITFLDFCGVGLVAIGCLLVLLSLIVFGNQDSVSAAAIASGAWRLLILGVGVFSLARLHQIAQQ